MNRYHSPGLIAPLSTLSPPAKTSSADPSPVKMPKIGKIVLKVRPRRSPT